MSARTIESLHPATWVSIQLNEAMRQPTGTVSWMCGCRQQHDGKVWLCTYHSGFDDGAWALDGDDSTDE